MNLKSYITLYIFLSFFITDTISQTLKAKDEAMIRAVMQMQEEAWNNGDIDKFMEGYLKSETLSFIGAQGPTYSWTATYQRYKRVYPDRRSMGKLKFEILDLKKIDRKTVYLIGRFYLKREIGDANGTFSLLWQKINGSWLIISDHTSTE